MSELVSKRVRLKSTVVMLYMTVHCSRLTLRSVLSLPIFISPMSGMLITAWQVYWAPCEVLRELNERLLSLVVPLTATVSLSITLLSPSLPPLQVTVSSASDERWATVVTVQVNSVMSPTLPVVGPETATSGSGRPVEREKESTAL